MIASALTASNTIAFILGALFCAVPVLVGSYYQGFLGIERLGFEWYLRDFQLGLVSLTGILYFVSLIALALYINMVIVTRRHWSRGRTDEMTLQFLLRTAGLAVALVSANYVAQKATATMPTRFDWTRNGLYTLDESTRETLHDAVEVKQPITVQAYVSNIVPREYVSAKNYFLGLLRQFERVGGSHVDVQVKTVQPFSPEMEEARTHGILATTTNGELEGRKVEQDVVLGAYVFRTRRRLRCTQARRRIERRVRVDSGDCQCDRQKETAPSWRAVDRLVFYGTDGPRQARGVVVQLGAEGTEQDVRVQTGIRR